MRLFHCLITMIVHLDKNVRGQLAIIKQYKKPSKQIKIAAKQSEGENISEYETRNAIVSIDYTTYKPPVNADDFFEKQRAEFPFDYHNEKFCDLTKRSIFHNMILLDIVSLKSE